MFLNKLVAMLLDFHHETVQDLNNELNFVITYIEVGRSDEKHLFSRKIFVFIYLRYVVRMIRTFFLVM